MALLAFRIAVFLAAGYLAVVAILFAFQGRFIYPAPQEVHDPAPGFEAVELLTADGLDLTMHWNEPEIGRPVVVWFHGNGGSLAGSTNETAYLAQKGYGVLLASYRGYGGNEGTPSEEGLYEDARTAMGFLKAQGLAPEQIIIGGNSIGSGPATKMATEFAPAALVLVSPFSSLVDAVSAAVPAIPVRSLLNDRYDNISRIAELDLPVLIQHGTADDVVPFAQGQALAEAAASSTFEAFEGAGHQLSFMAEAQVAQAKWLEGLRLTAELQSSDPAPDASGDPANGNMQPAQPGKQR